jgi:hypothetical protein
MNGVYKPFWNHLASSSVLDSYGKQQDCANEIPSLLTPMEENSIAGAADSRLISSNAIVRE